MMKVLSTRQALFKINKQIKRFLKCLFFVLIKGHVKSVTVPDPAQISENGHVSALLPISLASWALPGSPLLQVPDGTLHTYVTRGGSPAGAADACLSRNPTCNVAGQKEAIVGEAGSYAG